MTSPPPPPPRKTRPNYEPHWVTWFLDHAREIAFSLAVAGAMLGVGIYMAREFAAVSEDRKVRRLLSEGESYRLADACLSRRPAAECLEYCDDVAPMPQACRRQVWSRSDAQSQ